MHDGMDSLDIYKNEHRQEHESIRRSALVFASVGVVQLGMLIYWVGSTTAQVNAQARDIAELKLEVRTLISKIELTGTDRYTASQAARETGALNSRIEELTRRMTSLEEKLQKP